MIGIVSYGVYIPARRIKVSEIALVHGRNGEEIVRSLGLEEKAVASIDEDAATLAVESSIRALINGSLSPKDIGSILVGSESHPFAVNPTASTVGEILGLPNTYLASDLEFACKAGTTAALLTLGLVGSNKVEYGLAVGTDVAQAKPGDILECTAGSASASFIIGSKNLIAEIKDFVTFTSNTPDFWRRDGQKYPEHAGRFTGEPAYFHHVVSASKLLLEKIKLSPKDFQHGVFHMPNGKFPREAAKKLGFSPAQIEAGFIVKDIGNPYSASSLVGLGAVLDIAKPGEKIFVCSYGSGASSDAFYIEVTDNIVSFQEKNQYKVQSQINDKMYIGYIDIQKIYSMKGVI